tara:strand:- start:33 stop:602 length:570 start_codon:yes stop_codon:yes gene_type:complete
MAIATTISELYIKKKDFDASSDFIYLITPTNFDVSLGIISFGGITDESLDGFLRTNIRGFRMELSIPHEILINRTIKKATRADTGNPADFSTPFNFAQAVTAGVFSFSNSTVNTFFTDLITTFKTDGDDFVEVSFDGVFQSSPDDFRKLVLSSSSFTNLFTNQIGRDSSDLNFIGQKILTSIPTQLQAT